MGVIALVWLVRSFITSDTLSPVALLLILGLFVVALLLRKAKPTPGGSDEVPPSQKRQRKTDKHKSWISRIDK